MGIDRELFKLPKEIQDSIDACPFYYEWINTVHLDDSKLNFKKDSIYAGFEVELEKGNPVIKNGCVMGRCDKNELKEAYNHADETVSDLLQDMINNPIWKERDSQ